MNAAAAAAESKATDTKTRILDAAERVFAQDGFDAASLRTITAAANVNLAAVNYHFHTKEALFCAAVERRVRPINQRRLELLESIEGKVTPEKILEAFLHPPLEFASATAEIRPLMARLHSVPGELYSRIIEENFAPMMRRFVDELVKVLPDAPREELHWCMLFVVGAMTHAMAWGPLIAKATKTKSDSASNEALAERLIRFATAGLKASLAPHRVPPSKRANS